MKRLGLALAAATLALAVLLVPLVGRAQDVSGSQITQFEWKRLTMRNTTAANATALNRNWAAREGVTAGFTDSTVFRRGVTTRTVYDTTLAYPVSAWPFPPTLGSSLANAVADTSSVPWLLLRVRQDSVATGPYAFTGTSGLDSVRVAIEHSNDGINWLSCPGTPTHRFDTVFLTSGQDGLQSPTIIGVEASPGEDEVYIPLRCHSSQATSNSWIVNRTVCFTGGWVRLIVGGAYSGQFAIELGSWAQVK